jgi:hypothetical protein
MTSPTYAADDIISSIIHGVSTNLRPAIDPSQQLGLQSANDVDSPDIIDVDI